MAIKQIAIDKAYRMLNHGATTIVSARAGGVNDAMAIAWACPLDYDKITIVCHNGAFTRTLIEKSGLFAVQIPVATQKSLLMYLGNVSGAENPNKMDNVPMRDAEGWDVPLIEGCAAWAVCRVIPESRNESEYDLFIGQVVAVWGDDRVFEDGHWKFDEVGDELKTLHYVAGEKCYIDGKSI